MKNLLRVLLSAALLSALVSCQPSHSTGLVGVLVPGDTATTTLRVIEGVPNLIVAGTVQVSLGQVKVVLTPPQGPEVPVATCGIGPNVIDHAVSSPDAGTWELRVESVGGNGEYSLRMYY